MKKIFATLILSLLASLFVSTAFACGNKSDVVFLWMYDKKTDMFYATDYKWSAGNYNEVIPTDNGGFSFALRQDDRGYVTATAVYTVGTTKKVFNLTGRVYSIYKCLGSPGKVTWDQTELNDYGSLPAKYQNMMDKYERKVLGLGE